MYISVKQATETELWEISVRRVRERCIQKNIVPKMTHFHIAFESIPRFVGGIVRLVGS